MMEKIITSKSGFRGENRQYPSSFACSYSLKFTLLEGNLFVSLAANIKILCGVFADIMYDTSQVGSRNFIFLRNNH